MSPPAVVLVGTRLPANLGSVARVMANFGLRDLRLVDPACAPDDPGARAVATHGETVLAAARTYPDLAAALRDRTRVWATTALARDLPLPVVHPRPAAAEARALAGAAFLFGPERTGLVAADLARADVLVHIPTDPAARALNLAQAVAVMAWEWSAAPWTPPVAPEPAPRAEVDGLVDHLVAAALRRGHYSEPRLRVRAVRNLRSAVQRAGFTRAEVRTLRGLVRVLDTVPPEPDRCD